MTPERILIFRTWAKAILSLSLLAGAGPAEGQSRISKYLIDSVAEAGIAAKMIPSVGLAWVDEHQSFSVAYGLSNVEDRIDAKPDSTLFQLGSVGKVFTAIAVLQLVKEGKLDLHRDINSYSSGVAIKNPYATRLTLFHLLTHTSGLNDPVIGYLARNQAAIQKLGDHLGRRNLTLFQEPGKEINYSNYGYALAGCLVELASGLPFEKYVQERILGPLEMSSSTYLLPDDYRERHDFARGYEHSGEFEEVISFPRHALPAGSLLSTVEDMQKFLREMIFPSGRILDSAGYEMLLQSQFTQDSLLMGYTIGFEEQRIGRHRGIGKGGSIPGFLAELAIFPEEKVGWFACTNTETDNFLEDFQKVILHQLFGKQELLPVQPSATPIGHYSGVYRSKRYHHASIEDLFALYSGKMEFTAREDHLITYRNGQLREFRYIGRGAFQNSSDPNEFVVFTESEGKVTGAYTNINIAGLYLPVSLEPVQWFDDPVMINEYYGIVVLVIVTFLFLPLWRFWILFRRRSIPGYWRDKTFPPFLFYTGLAFSLLVLVEFVGGALYVPRHLNEFLLNEIGTSFYFIQRLSLLLPLLLIPVVVGLVPVWKATSLYRVSRIYYSLFILCAVIHVLFLWRWHFIGLHL